jgi:hypothetical protein
MEHRFNCIHRWRNREHHQLTVNLSSFPGRNEPNETLSVDYLRAPALHGHRFGNRVNHRPSTRTETPRGIMQYSPTPTQVPSAALEKFLSRLAALDQITPIQGSGRDGDHKF